MNGDDIIHFDDSIPSSLPPLRPSSSGSKPAKSLSDLKNQIKLLYPKVQQVEKKLENIKGQIPGNLNKNLLQMSIEMQKLRKTCKSSENDIYAKETKNDLSDRLKEIENRLLLQLDVVMKKSSKDLNSKISMIDRKHEEIEDKIYIEEPSEDIEGKLNQLRQTFSQLKKRMNSRLSLIESTYESCKNDDGEEKIMKNYLDNIELQKNQISELKSQLKEVNEQISHRISNSQTKKDKKVKEKSTNSEKNENNTKNEQEMKQRLSLPDIDDDIEEVQNDIQLLVQEFGISLADLHEKSQIYSQKVQDLTEISIELKTKVNGLNRRAQEVDNSCKAIISRLSEISSKIGANENQKNLQKLSRELQQVQTDLQSDITLLKNRIKNCEKLVPGY
ncbi:hypothetical protein TRFO_22794 [Tritrichomonas foetus]|uniref:Uncharacterized protein n=1 Tax=Tritrichomonas foetus TaxID=1144522 RepID=A0A1J4KCE7_9EUKA|nr:hypothetical protein TRFO_22794 [Tritrichomonas foetus]|eukprot:OHT08608.1 hypothetical protein TRFO_22794 [Tritrichomonas foetus]